MKVHLISNCIHLVLLNGALDDLTSLVPIEVIATSHTVEPRSFHHFTYEGLGLPFRYCVIAGNGRKKEREIEKEMEREREREREDGRQSDRHSMRSNREREREE